MNARLVVFFVIGVLILNRSIESRKVSMWVTTGDKSQLLQYQNFTEEFETLEKAEPNNSEPTITVNEALRYQEIDGFGFALTGGSASLIWGLPAKQRKSLIQELFAEENLAEATNNGIGISFLRVSL